MTEHGRYNDLVEDGRQIVIGVNHGMITLRIEGGRSEFRDSFLLDSEVAQDFIRDLNEAFDEVEEIKNR